MLEFCAGGLCFKDYHLLNDFEAGLIYDWRNDEAVRKFMINPAPISFNEHFDFLDALEAQQRQRRYFYVYSNYPIGTINLTNISASGEKDLSAGKSADLGLYIAPKLHGKGYGKQMLRAFLASAFLRAQNIKTLRLVVKQENAAAIALYKKCGFVLAAPKPATAPDLLHFELKLNR